MQSNNILIKKKKKKGNLQMKHNGIRCKYIYTGKENVRVYSMLRGEK